LARRSDLGSPLLGERFPNWGEKESTPRACVRCTHPAVVTPDSGKPRYRNRTHEHPSAPSRRLAPFPQRHCRSHDRRRGLLVPRRLQLRCGEIVPMRGARHDERGEGGARPGERSPSNDADRRSRCGRQKVGGRRLRVAPLRLDGGAASAVGARAAAAAGARPLDGPRARPPHASARRRPLTGGLRGRIAGSTRCRAGAVASGARGGPRGRRRRPFSQPLPIRRSRVPVLDRTFVAPRPLRRQRRRRVRKAVARRRHRARLDVGGGPRVGRGPLRRERVARALWRAPSRGQRRARRPGARLPRARAAPSGGPAGVGRAGLRAAAGRRARRGRLGGARRRRRGRRGRGRRLRARARRAARPAGRDCARGLRARHGMDRRVPGRTPPGVAAALGRRPARGVALHAQRRARGGRARRLFRRGRRGGPARLPAGALGRRPRAAARPPPDEGRRPGRLGGAEPVRPLRPAVRQFQPPPAHHHPPEPLCRGVSRRTRRGRERGGRAPCASGRRRRRRGRAPDAAAARGGGRRPQHRVVWVGSGARSRGMPGRRARRRRAARVGRDDPRRPPGVARLCL
jgi:hypothetical protein